MSYSMVTPRAALKNVGFGKGVPAFAWEQDKGAINSHLAAQFIHGRSSNNYLNDLLEYCWLVYSKSLNASGPQMIGRTGDLWVTSHLEKAGINVERKQTLWDAHTRGNIQVMDKWSPAVNDCWVLGGIHRMADFEIVSERVLKNEWDFTKNLPVVTAREILGLLHFGYKLKQEPNRARYVCEDRGAAGGATVEEYDRYMKGVQAEGPDSIRQILTMDAKLQSEIHTFDKSKLNKVIPPR